MEWFVNSIASEPKPRAITIKRIVYVDNNAIFLIKRVLNFGTIEIEIKDKKYRSCKDITKYII